MITKSQPDLAPKRKLLTTWETLHGQSRFKNRGWTGHTASYTLPWKQLKRAIGIFPRAHRRQIILSSRAGSHLLYSLRHGPHRDLAPGTSRSKAGRFELPISEPIVTGHITCSSWF